ncbi:MAG TPA: purine-nucleoside phosphorylase [Clostridiales bacterium]|jgi:purine-nucleoside phosphorylase|nr:purine-nucleoside phosphorylase [Clostridiales bacterium]
MSVPTAHNRAIKGEIAKTVLMPGDPLRAKFVAETYLEDAKLINNVRGIQGYSGKWKGTPVTVMASGMGIPSMGIYSYELFNFYDVENIIRIGSAGAISDNLKLRDIVFGMGACTNSNYASQFELPGIFAPTASYKLLKIAVKEAEKLGIDPVVGNILSSDIFYDERKDVFLKWKAMGVLAVEMEAAGLYMNAARTGKNALAICTISDHVITGEALDAEARQNTFTQMMELALNTAKTLDS